MEKKKPYTRNSNSAQLVCHPGKTLTEWSLLQTAFTRYLDICIIFPNWNANVEGERVAWSVSCLPCEQRTVFCPCLQVKSQACCNSRAVELNTGKTLGLSGRLAYPDWWALGPRESPCVKTNSTVWTRRHPRRSNIWSGPQSDLHIHATPICTHAPHTNRQVPACMPRPQTHT